jgi:cobalt-precorrin 5A hydrolase
MTRVGEGQPADCVPLHQPRARLWLGLGYTSDCDPAVIDWAIASLCTAQGWERGAIAALATLDHKAADPRLIALAQTQGWRLIGYSAAQLRKRPVPNPSPTVAAQAATPSVAEAAALEAAQTVGTPRLLLPKQIWRHPQLPGIVTLAVAIAAP